MMRKFISALLLIFMFTGLAMAQEEAQTPYETALQHIEAAAANGARELWLTDLGLSELPVELFQFDLSTVEYLYLMHNQLSNLPPEIAQLSSLEYLNLGYNQLSSLPPEIGQLNNLRQLGIEHNQLSSLPPDFGNLSSLESLWLGENQLGSLPSEIGNLSKLQMLSLHNNLLSSLPTEIARLTNLCYLDISNNRLQYLPTELGQLHSLGWGNACDYRTYGLLVDGNPLISPPDEVVEQGTPAILEYLRNEAWWHFQRLLLGGLSFVGVLAVAVLGLRWKNRRGKKKR